MAPRSVSNWRRPYTSIYNDNYRYGTGLYSDTLTDIEKRYSDSLSRTQLRSDRPDLTFQTFAGSTLTSSVNPAGDSGSKERSSAFARQSSRSSPDRDLMRSTSSTFESRLNTAMHSSYALDEGVQDAINTRMEQRKQKAMAREAAESGSGVASSKTRPKSLYDDAVFWSLPKAPKEDNMELGLDKLRSKRKTGGTLTPTNGPSSSNWREKRRILQEQVEALENNMSSCGNKLKDELCSLKSKYHTEISDLNRSVDQTSQQTNDLQRLCKRQQNQLLELQSAYDDSQRNVHDALEEVSLWQNKCRCIKKEMDRLKEEVELAVQKSSSA